MVIRPIAGFKLLVQDPKQKLRGSHAGVAHIDMGVGVVGSQSIDVSQHPFGDDPVQVDGDDDRQIRPGQPANPLEERAFGINLARRRHRAVQREQDAICRSILLATASRTSAERRAQPSALSTPALSA